jgi:hypothetical protein
LVEVAQVEPDHRLDLRRRAVVVLEVVAQRAADGGEQRIVDGGVLRVRDVLDFLQRQGGAPGDPPADAGVAFDRGGGGGVGGGEQQAYGGGRVAADRAGEAGSV